MDYVGRRAKTLEKRERRSTEEGEALVVIAKAVDGSAPEILRRVNEKRGRSGSVTYPDACAPVASRPFNFQIINDLSAKKIPVGLLKKREHEQRVHVYGAQRLGKRARDIAQTARLGERHSLGRKYRNAQISLHCARASRKRAAKAHVPLINLAEL
jgi:hypothetical protein